MRSQASLCLTFKYPLLQSSVTSCFPDQSSIPCTNVSSAQMISDRLTQWTVFRWRHAYAEVWLFVYSNYSYLLLTTLSLVPSRKTKQHWPADGPQSRAEEVRQEAGPDVIWRRADAAWLHSFRLHTGLQLELCRSTRALRTTDQAYLC